MSAARSSIERLVHGLSRRQTVYSAWVGLASTGIASVLAHEAFDAVTLDMQHGTVDVAMATLAIPLIGAAGKPAIVRIPVEEFQTASRMLDAGAAAIIAPMVNSVADAKRLVEFTKFPPLGERSWGPHGALPASRLSADEYLREANGFSLAFAMIETRAALDALDDILAVDGLDGVFVGPSDLSIALTGGAEQNPEHPLVDQALDRVVASARAAGKFSAAFAVGLDRVRAVAVKGLDLVAIGTDAGMLRAGARQVLDGLKRD
jgi:4-hydroxy-2-oxoheptanedioate aldolase